LTESLIRAFAHQKNQAMKKIRNITCILALATFIAGCVTQTPPQATAPQPTVPFMPPQAAAPQPTVPFDESALQPFTGKGTSTITGQAFLKTAGGEIRYGAGDNVLLIPVTPYTAEKVKALVGVKGEGSSIAANFYILTLQGDIRMQKYIRTVIGDGSGNFEFQNIPAGDYYIVCPIYWSVLNPDLGITDETGGVANTKTHIGNGETVKVVVTLQ
jgi:hypothetical protein